MVLPLPHRGLRLHACVVVAAWVRRREGRLVFLFGLGSFVLALIYSDPVDQRHLPAIWAAAWCRSRSLLLLFSQLLILAERW